MRLAAERKTDFWDWKMITIRISPPRTGSMPLSPVAHPHDPRLQVLAERIGRALAGRARRASSLEATARPGPAPLPCSAPDSVVLEVVISYAVSICSWVVRRGAPGGDGQNRRLGVEVGRRALHRHAAEIENRDAVRDLEHVDEVVGDHQHRDTPRSQAVDQPEHHGRLGHAQGGRRLVHDDEPGVLHHRPGHGHGLALAAGERTDHLADRAHRGHREIAQGLLGLPSPWCPRRGCAVCRNSRPRNMFWTMSRLSQRARSW